MSVLRTGFSGERMERSFVLTERPTVLSRIEEVGVVVIEGRTRFLDGLVLPSLGALLPTVTTVGATPLGREVVCVEVVLLTDDFTEDGEVTQLEEITHLVLGVPVVEEDTTVVGRATVEVNVDGGDRTVRVDDSDVGTSAHGSVKCDEGL